MPGPGKKLCVCATMRWTVIDIGMFGVDRMNMNPASPIAKATGIPRRSNTRKTPTNRSILFPPSGYTMSLPPPWSVEGKFVICRNSLTPEEMIIRKALTGTAAVTQE